MQFQVPQFLEVEDKLFGSFTFKQFLYVAGGMATAYLIYEYAPIWIAIPLDLAIVPFTFALAFLRVNNKPFTYAVEAFFKYITSARLYIWKKVPKKIVRKEEEKSAPPPAYTPRLSENKLKELAWTLDVKSHEGTI